MSYRLSHIPAYRKPPKVGAEYDGGLFTPSSVLDEMRVVDNLISSLADDVASAELNPSFDRNAFDVFRSEWEQFYRDNSDTFSRAFNKTYAMVLEYRERYGDWRRRFVEAGGEPSTPQPPEVSKRYGGSGLGKTVLLTGGLIGAAYLAWRYFGPRYD